MSELPIDVKVVRHTSKSVRISFNIGGKKHHVVAQDIGAMHVWLDSGNDKNPGDPITLMGYSEYRDKAGDYVSP